MLRVKEHTPTGAVLCSLHEKNDLNYLHSRGAVIVTAFVGPDVDDWSACQWLSLPEWVEAMCCSENVL